jgi:hypothetical protein
VKHLAHRALATLPASSRFHSKSGGQNFELLKADPHHPLLHFKKIGQLWSVRAGTHYRDLGLNSDDIVVWFWIGSHADYDKLV